MNPILAVDPARRQTWQAIEDLRALGYLHDGQDIFDATYGPKGGFWTHWAPPTLYRNDLDRDVDVERHEDYRNLSWHDDAFDVVVFDPPFKLNGTGGSHDSDASYGVDKPWSGLQAVLDDYRDGLIECVRVTKPGGLLLYKTQDQVALQRKHWLSKLSWVWLGDMATLIDEIFLYGYRAQPANRTKKCPDCGGVGRVRGASMTADCRYCDGTGRVSSTQQHVYSSTSVIQIFRKAKP